jgi:hypothetical protein
VHFSPEDRKGQGAKPCLFETGVLDPLSCSLEQLYRHYRVIIIGIDVAAPVIASL